MTPTDPLWMKALLGVHVTFLALVAVFSFYLAFSAYRVLRLKDLPRGGHAYPIDWIAGIFCFIASACLAGFGAFRPERVQNMALWRSSSGSSA